MFDKVKFWLPRTSGVEQFQKLRSVICTLDPEATFVGKANGGDLKVILDGHINNMRVREYLGGVSVYGSLNKWKHGGSNLAEMTLFETRAAVKELSEILSLNLAEAKVTEIEFGTNIILKNSVGSYFRLLGQMPRRVRSILNRETLYYQRKGEDRDTLVFYDKIKQAKKEKIYIPAALLEANVLRVELRLKRNIARLLHTSEIKGETLYDEDFNEKLLTLLKEKYMSIEKVENISLANIEEIKRPSDAAKFFFSSLFAEAEKGQEEIETYLQRLKDSKVFKDRADYVRTRKQIIEIANAAKIAKSDPLRVELDAAIKKL